MNQQSSIEQLSAAAVSWERSSTAERVADQLRSWITDRVLQPGAQLPEKALVEKLGVSRNTLREAFQLLSHEQLLVHKLHHGVFIREPSEDDVSDLYRARRILEPGALRMADRAGAQAVDAVRAAVEEGERAAVDRHWSGVGSANMHFHRALAGLAGSRRLDTIMARLLAEMALVFHVMDEPKTFHEPYLAVNRKMTDLLLAARLDEAEAVLLEYLSDAEQQLLEAFAKRLTTSDQR